MLKKSKIIRSILTSIPQCIQHFEEYPPVFIVGAPRSGTTLTLKLFNHQPQITTSFEPFEIWHKAFRRSVDDSYSDSVNFFGFQALRYFYYQQILPHKPYLVVKDPRDSIRIKSISYLFPNARFIHVIRDGRDVIASMRKTFQNELYLSQGDRWPHVRIPNYREMINNPPHINAAIQWQYCVETTLQDLSKVPSPNIFTFYYEDLIQEPEKTAQKIISFACPQIDRQELQKILTTISNQVTKNKDQPSTDITTKSQTWQKKMELYSSQVINDAGSGTTSESIRIQRWKQELNDQVLSECTAIIGDTLKKLGYQ